MGGDDAPRVEAEGAVLALRELASTVRTQLVGRTDEIEAAGMSVRVVHGGAKVACDARELVGVARLGSVYAWDVVGRPTPTVGLRKVGEEDAMGDAVVEEAHQLLKRTAGICYVGHVEGRVI